METCIICTLEKKLTDEHIIPEFMGGGLVVKNVCKECNSKMGSGFEGRISNNFIYQSARTINKIEGKSSLPFPFILFAIGASFTGLIATEAVAVLEFRLPSLVL